MEAPKKFNDNPTAATSLVKNGTEFIGIDQGGVGKKILAETLMTKANVGLGNVDNVSDVDKPVSDAQALINDAIKGVGWTDETVKGNADDIATLEADVTTDGSVLKSIKDNAQTGTFTPVGDLDAETIGGALGELDTEKADKTTMATDLDLKLPISGGVLEDYKEKLNTTTGVMDLSLGNVFSATPTANTTFSITNAGAGGHSFTLVITLGATAWTLAFPASVKWQE